MSRMQEILAKLGETRGVNLKSLLDTQYSARLEEVTLHDLLDMFSSLDVLPEDVKLEGYLWWEDGPE